MKTGTLYGIGVGPGEPDLITVKAAKLLGESRHVFVPKARKGSESLALTIAHKHINPEAEIHEVLFPMTTDLDELEAHWEDSARVIGAVLESGEDACFLTIGDAFLYSTYIYMLRALRRRIPDIRVLTVPGITAFSAAAALAEFPIGQAKEPVTIIPTADDLEEVRHAVSKGGTVILMKIGKRLGGILDILENAGALGKSVFVSHAGMDNQRIETDLTKLRGEEADTGYMSIILVRVKPEKNQ
jgi:precorrin-2/cobalt-factor-2 C20-methyltransferase